MIANEECYISISKDGFLSTYCKGGDAKLYNHAFGMAAGTDNIFMPGVLSRKKQVLPKILQAIDILKKS